MPTHPRVSSIPADHVGLGRIWSTWWPLAGSWVLMGFELPMMSAVVARLANPVINLAAHGSVVFPLALLIESPVIMLLAASTALSRDWPSYCLLRRFTHWLGACLTLAHVLVAFTPLYTLVVRDLIGVPDEVLGPARVGLMITTPWTWAIAVRRFQQGVLIRFGLSRAVVVGTSIRVATNVLVLGTGLVVGVLPGVVVAGVSMAGGVIAEAIYVALRVRPVLRGPLRDVPVAGPTMSLRELVAFYWPLAATPLIRIASMPVISAALSRMPQALESLAIWPVMGALVFMLRSLGVAFNEVVVALVDRPGGFPALRRFTGLLAAGTTVPLLVVTATPLAAFWFGGVCGLSPRLTLLAVPGLWLAVLTPALSVVQSWHQGLLVHSRRTRGVTEAVTIYLLFLIAVLAVGIGHRDAVGLYVGMAASLVGLAAQTLWLWYRSRSTARALSGAGQPAPAAAT